MVKKKIIAIIQARIGSIRLPNKALLKFGNETVLSFLVKRLSKSKLIDKIIIAIPKNNKNIELKKYINGKKYNLFEGSENDVLSRYFNAAKKNKADTIIRITADCPFHDPVLIDNAISLFVKKKLDFLTNFNPPTFPDGYDFSIIKYNILKKAYDNAFTKFDREHVVPYIIRSKKIKKFNIKSNVNLSNIRLTLDEYPDYEFMNKLIKKLKKNFKHDDIIKLYKKDKKLFEYNIHIKRDIGSKISKGQKLWIKAKNIIPSGNMLFSKNSDRFLPNKWPSYFSKAKGIDIWDLEGKKYKDLSLMGVGTNILGYSNKIVDTSVINSIQKGNMTTLNCPEEVSLAEKLIELHPWAKMAKFTRTGGEANAVAIRIARAYSKKDGVAICGYHGWHDWYLAANISDKKKLNNHLIKNLNISGVPKSLKNSVYPFRYNNFDELKKLIKDKKNIGTIKMEVYRNIKPKKNFLKNIRKLCDKKNLILIFDECTSGFRENLGGIHKLFGVNPDIAIFGKALGNGYPINAIIGKEKIMKSANLSFISSTFWTERLGPVAALKTIEIMEKNKTWLTISQNGKYLKKKWLGLIKKYKLKAEVSGLDSMPKFTFRSKYRLIYKTFMTQEMLKKGYLIDEAMYLSIYHNKVILDKYLIHFEKIIKKIKKINDISKIKKLCDDTIAIDNFTRLN